MESFLSTFIFLIPGIISYFWIQLFGLTPTVKHTAPEFSGIAAILWLPVSFTTVLLLNIFSKFINSIAIPIVWTLNQFSNATSNLVYLLTFLLISSVISFIFSAIWCIYIYRWIQNIVNIIRKKRAIAPLSSSTTVWEEFFIKFDAKSSNGKEALYKIYKIDKPEKYIIGSITKGARANEIDKSLVLENVQEWEKYIGDNIIPVNKVYVDFKSGLIVEELDHHHTVSKIKLE